MNNELSSNPTWNILKRDGSGEKVESLIHCFLERKILDLSDGIPVFITATGGQRYQCIYDNFYLPEDTTNCAVLISYQAHTYGNYAIIRNLRIVNRKHGE